MDTPDLVTRLARIAGLVPRYSDQTGVLRVASEEGRRRCLEAMGFDLSSPAAIRAAITALGRASPETLHVIQQGSNPRLPGMIHGPATISIHCEDGQTLVAHPTGTGEILPEHPLPLGYHQATAPGWKHPVHLAVTPVASFHPDWLLRQEQRWGVTTQIYTMRGAGPLGMLSDLTSLVEGVGKAGGDAVLINPICAGFLDQPAIKSPYQPSDRCFLNAIYIDVHAAAREFGVEVAWEEAASSRDIDYSIASASQLAGLRALHAALKAKAPRRLDEASSFGGPALGDYAAWQAARMPAPAPDEVAFQRFIQWLADHQLAQVASAASAAGMATGLMRDLPVGPAHDGFEAQQTLGGSPLYAAGADIGAPPDSFSTTGQNWGIAPLNPVALRRQGYAPFIELLRANMRHAGGLRIDHAMWLERVFWIPPGCDGTQGVYVRYPVEDLLGLAALESQRARCLLIGEDLGTVPPDFRVRMHRAGMLSTRLAFFERKPNGDLIPADRYPYLSAVQVTNHDLPPFRAWWRTTPPAERAAFAKSLAMVTPREGRPARQHPSYAASQRRLGSFLADTGSALALVRLEDVAQLDRTLNVPGTDTPVNWTARLSRPTAAILDETRKGSAWGETVARMRGRIGKAR